MPRNRKTITFSLPPEMEEQVRELVRREDRSISQLMRVALRNYIEESEWLRESRRERILARHAEQLKGQGEATDE